MDAELLRAAHAVVLPAFDRWDFGAVVAPFLAAGGCSVLIGESRAEYVARRMSAERRHAETAALFRDRLGALRQFAADGLIVAVDEELGGIRRLDGLVPDLPTAAQAATLSDAEIEAACFANATAARALGVGMYLAPVVDVVDGTNPWLDGRTLGTDAGEVARVAAAFVRGVQAAGIVAVTKHFPGFNDLAGDPALVDVTLEAERERILANAKPFAAAIAAGTQGIMPGPAPVRAFDAENAACTSPAVIGMLRRDFGFDGLVVSDDLDAPATLRGRDLATTALASLAAGADLLLVAGGPHLGDLCAAIAAAAEDGRLDRGRLSDAASRVRAVAAHHRG